VFSVAWVEPRKSRELKSIRGRLARLLNREKVVAKTTTEGDKPKKRASFKKESKRELKGDLKSRTTQERQEENHGINRTDL